LSASHGLGQSISKYADTLKDQVKALIEKNRQIHGAVDNYRPNGLFRITQPDKSLAKLVDESTDSLLRLYMSIGRLSDLEMKLISEKQADETRIALLGSDVKQLSLYLSLARDSLRVGARKYDSLLRAKTIDLSDIQATLRQARDSVAQLNDLLSSDTGVRSRRYAEYERRLQNAALTLEDTVNHYERLLKDSSSSTSKLDRLHQRAIWNFTWASASLALLVIFLVAYLYFLIKGQWKQTVKIKCLAVKDMDQAVVAKALIREDERNPVVELRRFDKTTLKGIIDEQNRIFTLQIKTGRNLKLFIFSRGNSGDENLFGLPGIDETLAENLINMMKNDKFFNQPPFQENKDNF
jgi:hypothetical protein